MQSLKLELRIFSTLSQMMLKDRRAAMYDVIQNQMRYEHGPSRVGRCINLMKEKERK